MKALWISFLVVGVCVLTSGCQSSPVRTGPIPGKAYETVGKAEGTATGIMLFQFIPIGQNSKFKRAYERAARQMGGDDVINMEIWESWFWAYVLDGYTTHIRGDVIKYK